MTFLKTLYITNCVENQEVSVKFNSEWLPRNVILTQAHSVNTHAESSLCLTKGWTWTFLIHCMRVCVSVWLCVCVSAHVCCRSQCQGWQPGGNHLFVITTVDRSAAQVNCNDNRLITPIKHHWAWTGDTGYSLRIQTQADTQWWKGYACEEALFENSGAATMNEWIVCAKGSCWASLDRDGRRRGGGWQVVW